MLFWRCEKFYEVSTERGFHGSSVRYYLLSWDSMPNWQRDAEALSTSCDTAGADIYPCDLCEVDEQARRSYRHGERGREIDRRLILRIL